MVSLFISLRPLSALGYRIKRADAAQTNLYMLEGEHLEAIYNPGGSMQSSYHRGSLIDEIVNGFDYGSGTKTNFTVHHDHLNSVTALSDHNGQAWQTYQYDPFGNPLATAAPQVPNDFTYTGREWDAVSGLYYYRARYYDPEVGRFVSEDPLGFEAGVNFYAYVKNQALIANDPTGKLDVIYTPGGSSYLRDTPLVGLSEYAQARDGTIYPLGRPANDWGLPTGGFTSIVSETESWSIVSAGAQAIYTTARTSGLVNPSLHDYIRIGIFSRPGGLWDFKPGAAGENLLPSDLMLRPDNLYVLGGTAHRHDFVGNVAWGSGMAAIGVPRDVSVTASEVQGWASRALNMDFSGDDPLDSSAIKLGYEQTFGGAYNWYPSSPLFDPSLNAYTK